MEHIFSILYHSCMPNDQDFAIIKTIAKILCTEKVTVRNKNNLSDTIELNCLDHLNLTTAVGLFWSI